MSALPVGMNMARWAGTRLDVAETHPELPVKKRKQKAGPWVLSRIWTLGHFHGQKRDRKMIKLLQRY